MMKAMSIPNNKALTLHSRMICADNSGAKVVDIISVLVIRVEKTKS